MEGRRGTAQVAIITCGRGGSEEDRGMHSLHGVRRRKHSLSPPSLVLWLGGTAGDYAIVRTRYIGEEALGSRVIYIWNSVGDLETAGTLRVNKTGGPKG